MAHPEPPVSVMMDVIDDRSDWPECLRVVAQRKSGQARKWRVDMKLEPVGFDGDKYASKLDALHDRRGEPRETIAAGLCVLAEDTGRVLMLQRALDDDDPASGRHEFPGGHIEDGEEPFDAAVREWEEETGMMLPDGQITGWWASDDGIYEGFVWVIGSESELAINPSSSEREVENPDNPDGDYTETAIWWDVLDLVDNPVVRDEVQESMDDILREVFGVLRESQAKAAGMNTMDAQHGGLLVRPEAFSFEHDNDDARVA
ncbi:MAG: NUDIX hydrolase [Planctomycetota bacterium]